MPFLDRKTIGAATPFSRRNLQDLKRCERRNKGINTYGGRRRTLTDGRVPADDSVADRPEPSPNTLVLDPGAYHTRITKSQQGRDRVKVFRAGTPEHA